MVAVTPSRTPSKRSSMRRLSDASIELLPWLEREFTLRAMRKTNSNQVRAAKLLGITRATLRKRLERNGALGNLDDE